MTIIFDEVEADETTPAVSAVPVPITLHSERPPRSSRDDYTGVCRRHPHEWSCGCP